MVRQKLRLMAGGWEKDVGIWGSVSEVVQCSRSFKTFNQVEEHYGPRKGFAQEIES